MARLEKLRSRMQAENLDAYVVMSPANRRYLSGFTGTNATLLITMNEAYLLTDFRYVEQARLQAPDFKIEKISAEPYPVMGELGTDLKRVGFEGDYVTVEGYAKLVEAFAGAELMSLPNLPTHLRSVKDSGELARIREAVRIADGAFDHILRFLALGQAETDISLELEFAMRRAGASGPAFDLIVASGWRSALPHGVASDKQIQPGEFLILDFGAVFQGYCSDLTRTVVLGEPTDRQREIYDLVLKANRLGIENVKPGRTGKEVDSIVRQFLDAAGYGECFGHGLGHSVGLAIHEGPNLNPREDRVLEPGMVVTVEPGVYVPGWGGVRIEDIVVVTEQGCEVLTQAPKEFIIIQ